ncbi:5'-3' exonuclease [Microbacterium kribbense]|uniref:5'-3' exonuclease n=1 Tax=Microbacterium kribbense TaxID=433645 RepID=A0ABP7GSX2_9MICO
MSTAPAQLMLLDSASLYFRAFFGVPDTVRSPAGAPINAVRGFLDIITKLVTTYRPTHLVACWDDDWRPQWRVDLIPTYKAHRVARTVEGGSDIEEVPEALVAQVPLIREALGALGLPIVGAPGYEADDIIGTLAARADMPVDVVTGDRDLFQLVDDTRGVRIVYTARGMSNLEDVTGAVISGRYGIAADQYADFATLRGDPSDGLPGVSGVGEKSAATLLRAYGSLDGIIAAAAAEDPGMTPRIRGKIAEARDYLAVAPAVVRVADDAPVAAASGRLPMMDEPARARAADLAQRLGLGASMTRIVDALAAATV